MSQEALNHLAVEEYMIPSMTGMWAVVNGPGSKNKLHTHPFNYLSGVFYLQVSPNSGTLTFHDPRPQAEVLSPPKNKNESIHTSSRVAWTPKQNDLLFFPSWLGHEVEKNNSNEERIVISFNLELKNSLTSFVASSDDFLLYASVFDLLMQLLSCHICGILHPIL